MAESVNTFDNIDVSIRDKIREGRERFDACTMRWVAMQLNVSADVVRHRLQKMQNDGLVSWNDMAGSLNVVEGAEEDMAAGVLAMVMAMDVLALGVLPSAAPSQATTSTTDQPAKERYADRPASKKSAASSTETTPTSTH